jgi:prepilin-type N-terminal cleavage/methylation domain-containing protein
MRIFTKLKPSQLGFTLVEMAIVLALITLLLGASLTVLSAQQDQRNIENTKIKLDEVREALIGYAIINGRLPCPASSATNGAEDPETVTGTCNHPYDGFVPAKTLAISGTDRSGYLPDSWGNPIHYAVTTANNNAFTTTNGMSTSGISSLTPDLQICSTAIGISGSPPSCASGASLASNGVPVVIYSTGTNMKGMPGSSGGTGGTGTDEAANPNSNIGNSDRVFVWHSLSSTNETGGEFDDQVIWLSQYTLFNRMVQAGKLP